MKFNCPAGSKYELVKHKKVAYGAYLLGNKLIAWSKSGTMLWVHAKYRGWQIGKVWYNTTMKTKRTLLGWMEQEYDDETGESEFTFSVQSQSQTQGTFVEFPVLEHEVRVKMVRVDEINDYSWS